MSDDLRAKTPWFVSGARTRHNAMPVLQIISEPTGEVLALVPYSDRTPKAHAECYADARTIAAAPQLLEAAELAMEGVEVLDLLIASIEKDGNYSVESTLGFLNQARCAKLRLSEAIAKAEGR